MAESKYDKDPDKGVANRQYVATDSGVVIRTTYDDGSVKDEPVKDDSEES